jgi:hypothetical protein
MTAQYLRKVSLVVGNAEGKGLDLSGLQFRFAVRRGDLQTPNSVDIRVYNVSKETARQIMTGNGQEGGTPEFSQLRLLAGYQDSDQYGLIFQGQIMQVRRGRESQADTFIDIRAADGDEAYNFAAGSTPQDHIDTLAAAMAIPKGYTPELPATGLPRGKVFYGLARDSMRDVAKTNDVNWSIQDGQIQLAPIASFVPGTIPVLTSATGMVGWPEQTANGIHIRCLLNPNIKISSVVKIDNASVLDYQLPIDVLTGQIAREITPRKDWDGFYVVYVAEHYGDTRGNEWYTDLICLGADPSAIPEFITGKSTSPPPADAKVVNPYG